MQVPAALLSNPGGGILHSVIRRQMRHPIRSTRVARWLVLLLVGSAASCGPKPTETCNVGSLEVSVPEGTPIEKHSETEFVAQIGKSKWRIAPNDDPEWGGWAGWINGFKTIETGENTKLNLMDGARQSSPK